LKIDTVAPTAPGSLIFSTSTPTSIRLDFGATTTEANFDTYKIFYKVGTSDVKTTNDQHIDGNLSYIDFNGASSTTVPNLSANTTYAFNIWAYDLAGNVASSTLTATGTTLSSYTPPTGAIVNAVQKSDGSGGVDIVILADDPDNDNSLRAKIEYVAGIACDFTTPLDPSLDETDENLTATYGDPDMDDTNEYQVGTSSSYIMTSPGSNYVFFDWLSKQEADGMNGTYCLRLTINDGVFDQVTPSLRTVLIDNEAPSAPGDLSLIKKDFDSIKLAFGAESSDPVFDKYKIFYKKGTTSVSVSDTEHLDANLLTANYGGATTTELTGLDANTEYIINIWAYDDYGNIATATEINIKTNATPANIGALSQLEYLSQSSITNGAWSTENDVVFRAGAHDQDSSDNVTFYYEIIGNASSFTSPTNVPASSCASSTAFSACASNIWAVSTSTSDLPTDWYNKNWLYRKEITIDSSQVIEHDTDFMVLATTTDLDLASKARSDGYDILFTDSSGTTTLPYEREYYSGASGQLAAWVKTDISSTTDITLYMYYGNAASDTDMASAISLWDSSYVGVWHLSEFVIDESSSVGAHTDSSSNTNTGDQNSNNEEISRIAYGQGFDGNDYINISDDNSLDITDEITLEAWVKKNVSGGGGIYNYTRTITLSTSTKANNFQVKLDLTSANFNYAKAQTNGEDLRFYDTNSNELNYWIEEWNNGGDSTIWVKVLSAGTLALEMYYGNGSATAQTDITGVMDADNLRYLYFNGMNFDTFQGTDLDASTDFTFSSGQDVQINGNSWEDQDTTMSIRWEGFIQRDNTGSHTFYVGSDDGSRVYVDENLVANNWSDHGYAEVNGPYTFTDEWESIRFEFYENGGSATGLLNWDPGTGRVAIPATSYRYRQYNANEPTLSLGTERSAGISKAGAYGFTFSDTEVTANINSTAVTSSIDNDWNHLVMTYDRAAGSDEIKVYINGVLDNTGTLSAAITTNTADFLVADLLDASVDELRLSNVARTGNRIRTEYNNQMGALVSLSSEERVQTFYETNLVIDFPDSSAGYKWQAMACDDDGDCSAWDTYNDTVPNFRVDVLDPTAPGQLTESSKTSNKITLAYGAQTVEGNFVEYKIFYSTSSPVTELDTELDVTDLDYIDYNGETLTTLEGLLPDTTYYFNIWAYDEVGRKSSSTISAIATNPAMSSPGVAFYTKGDRTLYYRVWDGTVWQAEASGPTLGSGAGDNIRQVRSLRSDNGGKIAVLVKTDDGANREWWGTIYYYEADTFASTTQLGATAAGATNAELISGCIATLSSGEFMVLTADTDTDGDTQIFTWEAGTGWTLEGNGPYTSTQELAACKFVRRPGTDNYLVVLYDDQSDVYTDYYYGGSTYSDSWYGVTEHSSDEDNANNFAGDAFFDPSDNTRGAIQFSDSVNAWYAQARYFIADDTSVNYGGIVDSPQGGGDDWADDFVHGEFGVNWNSTGVAYFVGRDIDDELNVYKVDASSPTVTWSTMTGGDNISETSLYNETNFAQLPFAINFYADDKGVVTWNSGAAGLPMYHTIDATTDTVSATSSVAGATSDIWNRTRIYDDPSEEEFVAIYQNDNVDYTAVFWDGASGEFYSSGNQAWTSLASGLSVSDKDDENISFSFSSYNSPPNTPSSMGQYKTNKTTAIANSGWTNESSIYLSADIIDPDTQEGLKVYLELLANTDTYTSTTSEPENYCAEGTTFGSCNSKIWEIASSSIDDFSSAPLKATTTITGLSNSSIGYKWRIMACDDESECSAWTVFNATISNFKVDTVAPTAPGALSVDDLDSESVTLGFGSDSVEDNFSEYRIYYKIGASGVTTSDSLHSTTSDANLALLNYGLAANTILGSLSSSTQYVFNIWAFDMAGNMASATPEIATTTSALANIEQTSYSFENDDGADVNSNSTASTSFENALGDIYIGERVNARIQIENNGGDVFNNKTYKLQYDTNGNNTWVDVAAATDISYSSALSGASGDSITSNEAAPNALSFVNGFWHEDTGLSESLDLDNNKFTELVFAIETSNASLGTTYRLRLYNSTDDIELNSYSSYPEISTIASDTMKYSKDTVTSLSSSPSDLVYFFDPIGYDNILNDDNVREITSSNSNIPVQYFAIKHANNTDAIDVVWNGQSSVSASVNNIYIQAYTYGSPNQWTTIASSISAVANTDSSISVNINANLSEYYGASNWTYFRVYQDSGTQFLRTDLFDISFSAPVADTSLTHYRWRNDDGNESTASWREPEDTGDPSGATLNLEKNATVRLRVGVANDGAGSASNYNYRLEVASSTGNCSSDPGGWVSVGTDNSYEWRISTSTYVSNTDIISTSRLSADGNTFTNGSIIADPSIQSGAITINEAYYTELEYLIRATNASVTAGTYCFRVTNAGTALDDYQVYPVLTLAGNTNNAPYFASGGDPYDSDSSGASASTTPTSYGDTITFTATGEDDDNDSYYLAVCRANSITAGNDGPPVCGGAGDFCISDLASSTDATSCDYTANDASEILDWYAFICDKHPGFSIAKCSAFSQGTGNAEVDSPIVINHPPTFTSVATQIPSQDPGSTFIFETVASDSDVSGSNDTLTLYICGTDSATWAGCDGITVCSSASSSNPYCSYNDVSPTPSGSVNYYAFIFDNHSLAATDNSRASSYTINNVAPVLGTVTLNDGNDISPNIKGMSDVSVSVVSASTVDINGCTDLVSAISSVYISDVANGPVCTEDDNYCYQITTGDCIISDCSGAADTSAVITCTANIKYHIMPTDDFSNNSSLNWLGYMQVNDGSNLPTATTSAVNVETNIALNVVETYIDFGSDMFAGDNTGVDNSTTTVENAGNSPIDTNLSGTDMTSPGYDITVDNIEWSLNNFSYTAGTDLTGAGTNVDIVAPKPTSTSGTSDDLFWGLGVPYGADASSYLGQNTFTVMLDGDGW